MQTKQTGKKLRGCCAPRAGDTRYGTLHVARRFAWMPRSGEASRDVQAMVFEKMVGFTSVATFFLPTFLTKNSKFSLSSFN